MPDTPASQPSQRDEDATLRILFIGPRPTEPLSLRATLEYSSTDRWRVSEVEGTEEGLAVLHTERFHLLVLDDDLLIAPRRTSLEVLRQAAPSTPIILRTTYRSRQAEADAAQGGSKPCCRETTCSCSVRPCSGSLDGLIVNGRRGEGRWCPLVGVVLCPSPRGSPPPRKMKCWSLGIRSPGAHWGVPHRSCSRASTVSESRRPPRCRGYPRAAPTLRRSVPTTLIAESSPACYPGCGAACRSGSWCPGASGLYPGSGSLARHSPCSRRSQPCRAALPR